MGKTDYVTFNLPDGTEVSNDPRWLADKANAKWREEFLAQQENTGQATPTQAQYNEMIGAGNPEVAPFTGAELQRGTPGTGQPDAGGQPGDSSGAQTGSPSGNTELVTGDDLDELDVPALKAQVKLRRENGVEVDTKGVKKKPELIDALKAADAG